MYFTRSVYLYMFFTVHTQWPEQHNPKALSFPSCRHRHLQFSFLRPFWCWLGKCQYLCQGLYIFFILGSLFQPHFLCPFHEDVKLSSLPVGINEALFIPCWTWLYQRSSGSSVSFSSSESWSCVQHRPLALKERRLQSFTVAFLQTLTRHLPLLYNTVVLEETCLEIFSDSGAGSVVFFFILVVFWHLYR